MSIEIKVPDIGEDEFEVTEIMVKVGDKVNIEQSLIIVEGEKSSLDIPAPFIGEVEDIKIKKGDKVKTGSIIMTFLVDNDYILTDDRIKNSSNEKKIKLSDTFLKPLEDLQITNISSIPESNNKFIENNTYAHATPLIRRLVREFGININQINPTGRKGRILREDVSSYIKYAVKSYEDSAITVEKLSGIPPWPKINFNKFGEVEEIEINRIKKISGSNLTRNWAMVPHVTIMEDADITEVEDFRKKQNNEMKRLKTGIKITPLVFVMKAVSKVLAEMIHFNSSISDDTHRLILKKYINIGVAVDTQNGLVVPVICDVNKKGIMEIAKELMEVSNKARIGKLTAADMQGGSFTISSLGSIGTTGFTPIINVPEVAIMGLSRSSMKQVWNGCEFISRIILPMSLSFDHRVIDGAEGARFVTRIAQLMSDIRLLIM